MKALTLSLLAVTSLIALGCARVDVTKTAKGFLAATDPNEVEILITKPDRPFIEVATITTSAWRPGETAKMHNALRAKAGPLGAHAVILLNSGMTATIGQLV